MILILDNYDSFTYNLVHLIASTGCDYEVWRND
jgi:anthranilate synthase component 2